MANNTAAGTPSLENDGVPGSATAAKDSATWVKMFILSTGHIVNVPEKKYVDVKDNLGLKLVSAATPAEKKDLKKLKRGTGFVQVAVSLKDGGSFRLICDPTKVGNLASLIGDKVHGYEISSAYLPKTQATR